MIARWRYHERLAQFIYRNVHWVLLGGSYMLISLAIHGLGLALWQSLCLWTGIGGVVGTLMGMIRHG